MTRRSLHSLANATTGSSRGAAPPGQNTNTTPIKLEETNAAIEQTEAQASELDKVVAIFTIDERPAGRASTPACGRPSIQPGLGDGATGPDLPWLDALRHSRGIERTATLSSGR